MQRVKNQNYRSWCTHTAWENDVDILLLQQATKWYPFGLPVYTHSQGIRMDLSKLIGMDVESRYCRKALFVPDNLFTFKGKQIVFKDK